MAVIKAVSSKAGIGQALDYVTKEEAQRRAEEAKREAEARQAQRRARSRSYGIER